ncbi:MAG: glycosyltransferase family 2 protein [Planctomycetes bacterium]|nr:glycosyltransferase family 2 protein [Planctomycetota bacterium]
MTAVGRWCAVVPTFDNPRTVRDVVETVRSYDLEVVLVDDGSGNAGQAACEEIGALRLAHVRRLAHNRGKGAAVQAGFAAARELAFTHVLQVDADGQHDLTRIPAFLAASRTDPTALVIGYPEYDETAPRVRQAARRITDFWVDVEVGKGRIRDAMVGFRVYPLDAVARLPRLGVGMDFDIEIAVRLVLAGVPTINLPVKVRYLTAAEGGVSHFRPLVDNLRFAWLHTRLCTAASFRGVLRLLRGGQR